MICLEAISRRFGTTQALRGVSLHARAGTVHGILGENGAGKSTLMRILFGLDRPDSGTIAIGGVQVILRSPRDAVRRGIGMVHQHFTLVPTFTVLDACILAAGEGLGAIDRRAWRARVTALTTKLRWQLDPAARIADLGVGQQQRVEILKALLTGGKVLILDEPTAVLTPPEVDELLPALRALADAGTTVLFISHKLHEVERLCDQVTILRRGEVVHDGPRAALTRAQMAEHLVGTSLAVPPPMPPLVRGEVRLAVEQGLGRQIAVHGGEIVAIAGVDGNGQVPLVQAILAGAAGITTPGVAAGERRSGAGRLGVIPDDRQHEALVLDLPLSANLALKDVRRPPFSQHGWLRPAAWRSHARELIARFAIRASGPQALLAALSGGNQQKVVIARELNGRPGLIIAVNPTRGLDLAASADVMQRLVEARNGGAGVLLVHHDLDELLAVADRVLVMVAGRVTDAGWPTCGRDHIGRLMLGAG